MLKIKLQKELYYNTVNEVCSTTTIHSTPISNTEQEKVTMTPVKFKILLTFPKWYNAMKLPSTNNFLNLCNFVIQVFPSQIMCSSDTMEVSMLSHGK